MRVGKSFLLTVVLAVVLVARGGGLAVQSAWNKVPRVDSQPPLRQAGKEPSLLRPVWSGSALVAIVVDAGLLVTKDFTQTGRLIPIRNGYGTFDSVYFSSARKGWAATSTGVIGRAALFATEDGGETWELRSSLASLNIRAILDMHFSESGIGRAVGFIMPGQTGVVLSTADAGRTWVVDHVDDATLYRLAYNGENAFASGVGSILRSDQRGRWSIVYRGDYSAIRDLAIPDWPNVIAVPDRAPLLRSVDNGATWREVKLPSPYANHFLGAIAFADAKRGWLVGNQGVILRTDDGGETWVFEAKVENRFLDGLVVTNDKIYAVGDGGAIFWRDLTGVSVTTSK